MRRTALALTALFFAACAGASGSVREGTMDVTSFGDDLSFLREHAPDTIVLSRGDARVAVTPGQQGRVMTSSPDGERGPSCGWINRTLLASGERQPHINAFGGEDRFWLGPEGGQYGLYFPPGAPFDLEHWQVPEPIDWGAWSVVARDAESVSLERDMDLVNASGTRFLVHAERRVRLLTHDEVGLAISGREDVRAVGYESINAITNTGSEPWRPETGLVSIWILSMYPPSPSAVVVIPFRTQGTGPIVNDAYFGAVPADRLRVDEEAGVVYFRADGERRSKIGVPDGRATSVLGSWDPGRGVLTLVRVTLPSEPAPYVNSMWEQQSEPYGGDVVNSYCDGPPAPGVPPLGPFYELESSSPAAALAPGARLGHTQTTVHVIGPRAALDVIARDQLGVGLETIEAAL